MAHPLTQKLDNVSDTISRLFAGREETEVVTIADLREAMRALTRSQHALATGGYFTASEICRLLDISRYRFNQLSVTSSIRRHWQEGRRTTYNLYDCEAALAKTH